MKRVGARTTQVSAIKSEDDLLSVGDCSFQSVYKGFVDCLIKPKFAKDIPTIPPAMQPPNPILIKAKEKLAAPAEPTPVRTRECVTRESSMIDEACKNLEELKEIQAELERIPFPNLGFGLGKARTIAKSQTNLRLDSNRSRKKLDEDSLLARNTFLGRFSAAKPEMNIFTTKRRSTTMPKSEYFKDLNDKMQKFVERKVQSNVISKKHSRGDLDKIALAHQKTRCKLSPLSTKGSYDIRITTTSDRKINSVLSPPRSVKSELRKLPIKTPYERDACEDKGIAYYRTHIIKTDAQYILRKNLQRAYKGAKSASEIPSLNY